MQGVGSLMRKRVMLVNDFYAPHMVGGAETVVRELAMGLQAHGHDVAVVTARIAGLPSSEIIGGIPVFRIGRFPGSRRTIWLASGTAPGRLSESTRSDFRAVTATFRPDVTHFHNVWLLGPACVHLASNRKGITIHDYWPVCVRRTLVRASRTPCPGPEPVACRLCRLRAPATWRSFDLLGIESERASHTEALASCDFVTAPSQYTAARIGVSNRYFPSVVYNGIDDKAGAVKDSEWSGYALFAGRPVAEKGYHLALRAFARPELQSHQLLVAANAALASPSSIGPNIKVLGQQPPVRMPALIAGAACVVVPSIWPENCPMIILEALRAGVPVVASRSGGIPELVEDGVSGILVPPGDVEALSSAISRCFSDAQLLASARSRGPAVVRERFSREAMVSQMEKLYVT
jgi:glycosyltransferase involved in cell wall biosynthesis